MTGVAYLWLVLFCLSAALLALVAWRLRAARAELEETSRARLAAQSALAAAESERRLAAARLDGLGQASLDALLVVDADRRVVWGNQVAWDMFSGGRPGEGQPFIALVHDYELNQAVVDALGGHRSIVRQSVLHERTLRIRAVPTEDGAGAAVVVGDVTELQRLGRARREFVANISHELRTPLANIDLAAQTLANSGLADGALAQRMLSQIGSQVEALSQLSQEMMDLAQIESGQVLLKLVPSDLNRLVRGAIEILLPQAAHKNQRISVTVPDGLMVLADDQQMSRVVRNLVHNAIKFTPDGGSLCVSGEAAGDDDVMLCVADNGPGIPEAEQGRIFERFYKQDRARSKGGTGLGLAIARHIVEGHGGRIWVESQPGQGAKFCLTLPRA
jgi:two-component system, OmpR family, phosphate regulon sensor histidine kinase PhoR